MQGERSAGDGHPVASGGSPPDSSFPKGTENSARPAFGDRTSVAVAVALMVALTLLFLPWSTIRPGLTEGGRTGDQGVGAAPSGAGPVLTAPAGSPILGDLAIMEPVSVTIGSGPGAGPSGPITKPKPPALGPGSHGRTPPTTSGGTPCKDRSWGCGNEPGHGHDGHHGHGHGGDGHGGGDGGWGGGHGDGHHGHHGDGHHGNGHHGDGHHGHHGNGHHGDGHNGGSGWGHSGGDGHHSGHHKGHHGHHGKHGHDGSRTYLA